MNSNLNRQGVAANIMKMFAPELIKGGEGSKGGHVTGHSQSGAPIYAQKKFDTSHVNDKEFNAKDHDHYIKHNFKNPHEITAMQHSTNEQHVNGHKLMRKIEKEGKHVGSVNNAYGSGGKSKIYEHEGKKHVITRGSGGTSYIVSDKD